MGLFTKKTPQENIHAPKLKEELRDLSDLNSISSLDVDDAIKKDFSYDQFQTSRSDDSGNYFGVEFNIQATIGRLKGLYLREPWVNTCTSLIARNLSTIPFRVYKKGTDEVVKNHPLEAIINSGNYITSQKFRDTCSYSDLVLSGNYFLILDKEFKSCFWVPVETVTPNLRGNDSEKARRDMLEIGPLESITIGDNSLLKVSEENIPFERVIHIKLPNPFNPFYGLPLIVAGSRPILLDRYKNEYEMAFYLRGGMHSGVIETEQDISKSRMERLMRTFEQAFTGKRNWWRQLFLPKGAKWINSTLSMAEMQHLESLKENRMTLLANLGIPPSQVGIVQDVNRSTAEDQKANLWNNTIVPLALMIESGWNSSWLIKKKFGDKVYVKADFEGLDALEGSFYTKCELAEKAKNYMTIDEIREFILNIPKLGDDRGDMFVAEIVKSNAGNSTVEQLISGDQGGDQKPEDDKPADNPPPEEGKDIVGDLEIISKKKAIDNQDNVEKLEQVKYQDAYMKYLGLILANARYALRADKDVGSVLAMNHAKRRDLYIREVLPVAFDILDRSFNMASDSTKSLSGIIKKVESNFDENDELAISIIMERTKEGKRLQLAKRLLNGFVDAENGIDATRSEEIMKIIEDGLLSGKTTDQIAQSLEKDYKEQFGYRTDTIVRTEILSAVSEGIEWNHEVLKEVFTEVNKQWFHVGDTGSNPDARDEHFDFEKAGIVPSDYVWYNPTTGARLSFPRDPKAGAKDIINCRCTMVSVVPKDARSRSDLIVNI